jgi:hypothetical protein
MFVLFIAGEPMTGQRMFQSDEEEGADWQVSALPILFYSIILNELQNLFDSGYGSTLVFSIYPPLNLGHF